MPAFTREFPLDPEILGQGSAEPRRRRAGQPGGRGCDCGQPAVPDGPIALGQISVGAGTGSGLVFKSGAATVNLRAPRKFRPASASSTRLPRPWPVSRCRRRRTSIQACSRRPARAGAWAAMRWAYSVTGNVSGAYPIGLVGGASVGVAASRAGVTASFTASPAEPGRVTCSRRRRKAGACRGR